MKNIELPQWAIDIAVEGLQDLARRLEALGLFPGSRVKILQKKRRGAMIITVRGTRFALGMEIAAHIAVKGGREHAA